MKYLIDTHTFLWFISGSSKLSATAKQSISNSNNEIVLSIASLWEISIKTSLNKLEISGSYESVIQDVINFNIEILSINFLHTLYQSKLPLYHRDPFDRMIISQAKAEGFNLISGDQMLDHYFLDGDIKRIW